MSKSEEFEQHYQKWVTFGMSKAAYCKQFGLAYHWFFYHEKHRQIKEPGFTQIRFERPYINSANTQRIKYHFAGGSFFVRAVEDGILKKSELEYSIFRKPGLQILFQDFPIFG